VRRLWLEALEHVDKGSREEARTAVDAALSESGGGARFQAIAVRFLLLAGDFAGALRALARAEATASMPDERYLVLVAQAFVAGTLGDFEVAITAFKQLSTDLPSLSHLLAALELSMSVAAPTAVLRWTKLIVSHPAVEPEHLLRVTDFLHQVGEDEAASAVILDALDGPRRHQLNRCAAAQLLLSCRACDEAAELFRSQIAEGEGAAEAHLGLATIHLWRAETGDADRHAHQALGLGADVRTIDRVLAAVALLEGRVDEALTRLDSLAASSPDDAETRAWRAEALLRCGQPEAALAEVRVAGDLSPDHSAYVVLRIVAALAELRLGRRPSGDVMIGRVIATLCGEEKSAGVRRLARRRFRGGGLWVDRALAVTARLLRSIGVRTQEIDDSRVIESMLESALVVLGGNRMPGTPTRIDGGRLSPLVLVPSPRSEVKAALHSVRSGGYEEASRQLAVLIERYPDWPHPWFYRAELQMWVGRLDDARRDLEIALAKKVRGPEIERGQWPSIGLAGVHLLQGRPHQALRTIERGTRRFGGPHAQPYFAWRGEILRALGRLDEARAMLEKVCPPGGRRLGSLITLALTYRDLGDRDRPRQILARLLVQAPGLMVEVTSRILDEGNMRRVVEVPVALGRLSDDETHELLVRALAAMRGNRSASCLTFVDAANRLRCIPPDGVYRFVNRSDELKELQSTLSEF
jgi:tetratricopeptide (TPR) repeat protein